jgi:hypothetical protein
LTGLASFFAGVQGVLIFLGRRNTGAAVAARAVRRRGADRDRPADLVEAPRPLMIANLLLFIPGAGPFLAAGWRLLTTPTGRRVAILTLGMAASFAFGWSLKTRLDRSATLQAVIAKQRIDLRAAADTAEQAAATAAAPSDTDSKNQDVIRDLQQATAERRLHSR